MAGAVGTLKAWKSYSFAPEWFADASREAKDEGRGARRREILFAVCAAESYVFEWVRDTVLNHDFKKLDKYFPAGQTCGGPEWNDFRDVVHNRDGLVHAAASRPETDGQPEKEKPVPAASDLDAQPPGWALEIVRVILRKLHTDTKTTPIPELALLTFGDPFRLLR